MDTITAVAIRCYNTTPSSIPSLSCSPHLNFYHFKTLLTCDKKSFGWCAPLKRPVLISDSMGFPFTLKKSYPPGPWIDQIPRWVRGERGQIK